MVTGAVTVNAVAGGATDEVVRGGVSISIFFFRKNAALIAIFPSARSTCCPRSRHTSIILLFTLLTRKDHDSRSDSEHLLLPTVSTAYSPHSFIHLPVLYCCCDIFCVCTTTNLVIRYSVVLRIRFLVGNGRAMFPFPPSMLNGSLR